MKLTDEQRAAVKTWRKGNHGAIVSDLSFSAEREGLSYGVSEYYGGRYLVCESRSEENMDFILAATKAAAEASNED